MRRIVELYDLLDWQGVGFIDLTNLDDKMHGIHTPRSVFIPTSTIHYYIPRGTEAHARLPAALSPSEQAFLRPILERHAAVEASMDMETFVSLMTAAMNERYSPHQLYSTLSHDVIVYYPCVSREFHKSP